MSTTANTGNIKHLVDDLYRREGRRIFATLVRLVGDFELAEEASGACLAEQISEVLAWSDERMRRRSRSIERFVRAKKLWSVQADRFAQWLENTALQQR